MPEPVTAPAVAPATEDKKTQEQLTAAHNERYRRLLPAVLFLLTFVTVMTVLLIYMDTVALGAQQFRLNMTRDYELAKIQQDSPQLIAYVRQVQLSQRDKPPSELQPVPTRKVAVLDDVFGKDYVGTFIEILPSGGRDPSAQFLETARGWRGACVRAAPRDYLALRGRVRALHACLSATKHPREVTYNSGSGESGLFSSRVLCLPLLTVLLATESTRTDYLLLSAPHVTQALDNMPENKLQAKVIEIRSTDPEVRNATSELLLSRNYTVKQSFDDAIMYLLQ